MKKAEIRSLIEEVLDWKQIVCQNGDLDVEESEFLIQAVLFVCLEYKFDLSGASEIEKKSFFSIKNLDEMVAYIAKRLIRQALKNFYEKEFLDNEAIFPRAEGGGFKSSHEDGFSEIFKVMKNQNLEINFGELKICSPLTINDIYEVMM